MADKTRINKLMEKAMSSKVISQTPVAEDGAQPKRFSEPSQKRPDPSKNLGKFLHPKSSPVSEGSKNENAAGSKVRPGF